MERFLYFDCSIGDGLPMMTNGNGRPATPEPGRRREAGLVIHLNDHRVTHRENDPCADPFLALQLEHERALFLFYGYRTAEGEIGRGYFALAHSLAEALRDLHAAEDVDTDHDLGYLVQDAFIERDDDGSVVVHAEVISVRALIERAQD